MARGVRGGRAGRSARCTPTRARPASTPGARWSWRWRWAYKHDAALKLPYQDNLSALIHEPSFKQAAGEAVFSKARVINTLGNRAVHGHRADSGGRRAGGGARAVPRRATGSRAPTAAPSGRRRGSPSIRRRCRSRRRRRSRRRSSCSSWKRRLRERDEKLAALLADKTALDEELKRLRAEVAAAKKAAAAQPDTHDYSEAETRDYFIDLLLKEAGWPLDQPRDREFEVAGMPNSQGKGFVDYVLWGDDGKPLGLVEAKRTRRDARVGQQQAKLYADCLEQQFGQRPVIFYSNGYEHWLWDDARYPPRAVQGFYKKAELELLIQRREHAASRWRTATINADDRRALLPDARHPAHRRGLRARPRPQGAAGDGHRRGQDAHGDRARATC